MGVQPKMSDKDILSQPYSKKRDSLSPNNLDTSDLAEQVQALYPSELKIYPIDKDMLKRFNAKDFPKNLNTLDLTEQVQALYPSEIKS